jgi:hypothetical protein
MKRARISPIHFRFTAALPIKAFGWAGNATPRVSPWLNGSIPDDVPGALLLLRPPGIARAQERRCRRL